MTYTCQPTLFSRRTYEMHSQGELYATMKMSFFGAQFSGKRSLEIIPNKKVFPTQYSVVDNNESSTAVLDFGGLKTFPEGRITTDGNTEYVLERDDRNLILKCDGRVLILLESIHNGFFSIPSLKVTAYDDFEHHDTFDALLFLGWYAMVGTVMGLNDG